jgi:methionyl-tRNA formyltransferase
MRIDAGLDTGDMLLKAETEIGCEENAIELGRRLAPAGADLLVQTLQGLAAGSIVPEKQDDAIATYAPILKKEDGRIDWRQPAHSIHAQIRGFQPWPGAFTVFRGQTLHIWRSAVVSSDSAGEPGLITSRKPFTIACGASRLELIEVQLEGRKRISASDFANGQRLTDNDSLGDLSH